MVDNDYAFCLTKRSALESIASKLAPTVGQIHALNQLSCNVELN
jgi:hypothetical protein